MISYEPFFQTLKKKGISSYKLGKMGFPMTTYHSIKKGKHISTQTVNALCELLDCEVADILKYTKDAE